MNPEPSFRAEAVADREPASLLQALRSVLWAFIGIRRHAGLDQDVRRVNPLHLVIAALMCAAVLVGGLALLVGWVVRSGVASG